MNRNCVPVLPHTLPMITIIQASSLSTQTRRKLLGVFLGELRLDKTQKVFILFSNTTYPSYLGIIGWWSADIYLCKTGLWHTVRSKRASLLTSIANGKKQHKHSFDLVKGEEKCRVLV